jgi:hypothetical protein
MLISKDEQNLVDALKPLQETRREWAARSERK